MTKPVPYYPLYAANFISSKTFRLMSIEERGLWITIQMECWVNGSVPSGSKELAQYLGATPEEINRSLTEKQFTFLENIGGELKSPELEEYRKEFLDRREKQRLGGIDGAKKKKAKQAEARQIKEQGTPEAQPKGSLVQINSNSFNSSQLLKKELMNDEVKSWIKDYENAPEATSYLKASRG